MRICVFCGSSSGNAAVYAEACRLFVLACAENNVSLVYGGGKVGLMGVLADAALAAGIEITGVVPRNLVEAEIAHGGLTSLHVVSTMHQRKALMADLADAFVALPGGAGTLEELLEQWTWAQIGLHAKPCALLNVGGFFDPLIDMVDHMVNGGFLAADHGRMLLAERDAEALLAALRNAEPVTPKWLPARPGADRCTAA